ncbi:MAG: serine hydrolase domain-containing protein [Hyphomonadaceae bacterium]
MTDLTRRGALGAALPLATTACVTGGLGEASSLPAALTTRIDDIFAAPNGAPGHAVAIFKDGETALAKGYGLANIEDGVAITTQTRFHIASLSKQFTGAAVALSILDGAIALDDPLARHLPEFDGFAHAVQLRHLIYMTSGLPEYTSLVRRSGLPWFSAYRFTVREAIETVAAAGQLEFAPGSRWAYRNINYMLLSEVVARRQGLTFARFLQERVFAPLAMGDSLVDDDATTPIAQRAIGYAPREAAVVRDLNSVHIPVSERASDWLRMARVSPHYGGSGVFTTLADWAKWDANWTTHRLGGQRFYDLMHARQRFAHDKDNDAFGLVLDENQDRMSIWYSGGDIDASSYVVRFPAKRLTIVCLSNNPMGQSEQRVSQMLPALAEASLL